MTSTLGEQLPAAPPEDLTDDQSHAVTLPIAVMRIPVSVQVVIGSTRLPLSRIAELAPGTMLALEEKLGTPARMLVNGREVARGELFVIDATDGRLGITISEVAADGGPA